MPLYHEDDYALYVHAGLDQGKHPRDSKPQSLLWSRDMEFYKNYRGKPCVFGHTPTAFLPLRGRLGRHGIYIFNSAIGHRQRLQPPVAAELPVVAGLHSVPDLRRRPRRDTPHHLVHSRKR